MVMHVEKCVIYINKTDVASRSGASVIGGKYCLPITLPKVKCLDEFSDKYFPYDDHDPVLNKKLHDELARNHDPRKIECTERDIKFYELSKNGSSVKEIASMFFSSNDDVRAGIVRARIKFGEIPSHRTKNDHNHVEHLVGRPLSDHERRIYEMNKGGMSNAKISEVTRFKRGIVSDALRRARKKLGEF